MSAATDLMVTLAKIQTCPQSKRAQMVAEARAKWAGHVWSSEGMKLWARAAWLEGLKQ